MTNHSLKYLLFLLTNESHPNPAIDYAYKLFRQVWYGRNTDIETITYYPQTSTTVLHGTSAGKQRWSTLFPSHLDHIFYQSDMTFEQKRPILYVNTWNHMF